jgi:hypothetical protein
MRRSRWTPSIVPNDREANVLVENPGRGITYRDPAVAEAGQFRDPIPAAYFPTLERRSEEDVSVIQRRSDLALQWAPPSRLLCLLSLARPFTLQWMPFYGRVDP